MFENIIKITVSCTVSEINVFYAEMHDGHQKWQENDFCEELPINSADTLVSKILSKSLYLEPFPR